MFTKLKAWREKRHWESQHLAYIRQTIDEAQQWLGGDERIKEVLARISDAASDDWYTREVQRISAFRTKLGLDPVYQDLTKLQIRMKLGASTVEMHLTQQQLEEAKSARLLVSATARQMYDKLGELDQ